MARVVDGPLHALHMAGALHIDGGEVLVNMITTDREGTEKRVAVNVSDLASITETTIINYLHNHDPVAAKRKEAQKLRDKLAKLEG